MPASPRSLPRRGIARFFGELGPGGISSFALAFGTGLLGLSLPVLWRVRQVAREAASDERHAADLVVVLGRMLEGDLPSAVFRARLEHGAHLWREGWAPWLLVSGGRTGTASRSEAAAGRELLLASGVPAEVILTEEGSRHTLENLVNVRAAMRERGWRRLILVSDPLHVARVRALARGLGLDVNCSPAPGCPPRRGSLAWWRRAGREGFLLHWYHVGIAYSRAIRSERLLRRVT